MKASLDRGHVSAALAGLFEVTSGTLQSVAFAPDARPHATVVTSEMGRGNTLALDLIDGHDDGVQSVEFTPAGATVRLRDGETVEIPFEDLEAV